MEEIVRVTSRALVANGEEGNAMPVDRYGEGLHRIYDEAAIVTPTASELLVYAAVCLSLQRHERPDC